MLFLFTKYRSLTLLSFESFHIVHIGFVREMFTPRQSTVNEATRGIRRSIPMMLCGLLSNLLCVCLSGFRISGEIISFKYLNYFEGGGRESFSIAHACFLPCAREQDEKSRFLKRNGKRWKIFRKIR